MFSATVTSLVTEYMIFQIRPKFPPTRTQPVKSVVNGWKKWSQKYIQFS